MDNDNDKSVKSVHKKQEPSIIQDFFFTFLVSTALNFYGTEHGLLIHCCTYVYTRIFYNAAFEEQNIMKNIHILKN